MYFLTEVVDQDQGVIDILKALFSTFWNGLCNVPVPGFDFSFADVFIALLTAGFIGIILKTLFALFGSHFTDGKLRGRASGKEAAGKDE